MEVIKEELDSEAFGRAVLKLSNVDSSCNFGIFEKNYIEKYDPKYVYAKLDVDKIDDIHYLEQNGFEFIECQLQLFTRLTRLLDTTILENNHSLKVEEVSSEDDLPEIYKINDLAFNVDRIFIDSKLDNGIAHKRYHSYIRNSFLSDNQRLDKITDVESNRIIGFHTLNYKNDNTVLLLLGAILPEFQRIGIPPIFDAYVYNDLFKNGKKNIITHVSACNVKVLNYLQKNLGFKIRRNFIVLRKIY